jgi:hypothetical protein
VFPLVEVVAVDVLELALQCPGRVVGHVDGAEEVGPFDVGGAIVVKVCAPDGRAVRVCIPRT